MGRGWKRIERQRSDTAPVLYPTIQLQAGRAYNRHILVSLLDEEDDAAQAQRRYAVSASQAVEISPSRGAKAARISCVRSGWPHRAWPDAISCSDVSQAC